MHEEVNQRAIALTINTTKLTAQVSRIDDILNDVIGQGYTSEDIKKSVILTLKDLFENENNLVQFAMTGDILQMWDFVLRYCHDSSFIFSVKIILSYYRQAYNENPLEVKKMKS